MFESIRKQIRLKKDTWKSEAQLSSSLSLTMKSANHCPRGNILGYALIVQFSGTLSMNNASSNTSIALDMVNSPYG